MLLNVKYIPPEDCQLKKNSIDIWEFPLNILPPLARTILNADELNRADRYYFERHKRRFTVARALLRIILGHYLQKNGKSLNFIYNKHGKPELKNSSSLQFNLSHSRDLALVAIGQQFSLGVDLEFYSARPYDGIAKHLFSEQELALFLTLPNYLKPQAFFNIWASKEAFIKGCGLGLAYPTKLFTVPVFGAEAKSIKDDVFKNIWQLSSFMPKIGCAAALCHHPEVTEIQYIRINDSEKFLAHFY
ncbi:MAG: 4'-phosphopantetheinyl transferase superfamily protein [Tatlockia sp.]|nr:4'-phosphopantetheinyl transferase superfamily protein [Tatlockia sp.]